MLVARNKIYYKLSYSRQTCRNVFCFQLLSGFNIYIYTVPDTFDGYNPFNYRKIYYREDNIDQQITINKLVLSYQSPRRYLRYSYLYTWSWPDEYFK